MIGTVAETQILQHESEKNSGYVNCSPATNVARALTQLSKLLKLYTINTFQLKRVYRYNNAILYAEPLLAVLIYKQNIST